jgi:hypothetical protein
MPGLSTPLCVALSRALNRSTPWWVGVRLEGRPGGYRLRLRNRRPPHFGSSGQIVAHSGEAAQRFGEDPTGPVCEILGALQHFIGKELQAAWPATDPLPPITQPIHEMVERDLDAHRSELLAWMAAFPEPHAGIVGDRLEAWYGRDTAPVLALPALPLP